MRTPVCLLIFNRPHLTRRVFEAIRRVKPQKLYVVADGPRSDHPDDAEKCAITRSIIGGVNWDCEISTNYSDSNLGCKKRVSSGLAWVFDRCDEAIFLEDDCLPDTTFFQFCEQLLEKYRDEQSVSIVSGNNFQFGQPRTSHSYYFSRFLHMWGWASWRRTWQNYDLAMKMWPTLRESNWLNQTLEDPRAVKCWRDIFDRTYAGTINTWDYQWVFSCWAKDTCAIVPKCNLVSNIGFGDSSATHTSNHDTLIGNLPLAAMRFPLVHPPVIVRDNVADQFDFEREYLQEGLRSHKNFLRRSYRMFNYIPALLRSRFLR